MFDQTWWIIVINRHVLTIDQKVMNRFSSRRSRKSFDFCLHERKKQSRWLVFTLKFSEAPEISKSTDIEALPELEFHYFFSGHSLPIQMGCREPSGPDKPPTVGVNNRDLAGPPSVAPAGLQSPCGGDDGGEVFRQQVKPPHDFHPHKAAPQSSQDMRTTESGLSKPKRFGGESVPAYQLFSSSVFFSQNLDKQRLCVLHLPVFQLCSDRFPPPSLSLLLFRTCSVSASSSDERLM